ncbi:required for excision 1-B domain-containing protein-like isoform X1 [Eriocheir sinensis]|uniref:required for excision 1-B domain-containing protein-like isoform X1 n=2 Tax=Eriocheir sinensis TaxID=95602 RepID=UPI0021C7B56C|nr:required for excision 1-B domain-containing protein-like isoform X1 [Eriocheir sinensis]
MTASSSLSDNENKAVLRHMFTSDVTSLKKKKRRSSVGRPVTIMRDHPEARQEGGEEATTLVSRFNQLQEERVLTYRRLDDGHKAYLATRPQYDFTTYRHCVHDVTQAFSKVSEGVLEVEAALRSGGHTALADILEAIQECERRKLELTVHLQLARQMVEEVEEGGVIMGGGELERSKVRELRGQLGKVVEEINDLLTELRYEVHGEGEGD